MEIIALKEHTEEYPMFTDWDSCTRAEFRSLPEGATSFNFIAVFLIIYQYLFHLLVPTQKLQGRAIDIIQAHQINDLKVVYRREREEVGYQFQKIYNQAILMADAVGTMPSLPS